MRYIAPAIVATRDAKSAVKGVAKPNAPVTDSITQMPLAGSAAAYEADE